MGTKLFPITWNSGTILTITSTQIPTMTSRCAMDHRSMAMYARSIGRKNIEFTLHNIKLYVA